MARVLYMAHTVTALVAQKRNKDRVNVYLDGEFAFGLAAIEAIRLKRGQVLSDEDIARLRRLDESEQAHQRALRFLSYRPRSEAEVRGNLRGAAYDPAVIDAALERLRRAGLVDDRAFVRYWLENRGQFSPRAGRALRSELRRKGVAAETIEAVLAEVGHDEGDAAYRAALPKARRMAGLEAREFRRRLGDYLARRGFDYATAQDAVRRTWEEVRAEAPTAAFQSTSEE